MSTNIFRKQLLDRYCEQWTEDPCYDLADIPDESLTVVERSYLADVERSMKRGWRLQYEERMIRKAEQCGFTFAGRENGVKFGKMVTGLEESIRKLTERVEQLEHDQLNHGW